MQHNLPFQQARKAIQADAGRPSDAALSAGSDEGFNNKNQSFGLHKPSSSGSDVGVLRRRRASYGPREQSGRERLYVTH